MKIKEISDKLRRNYLARADQQVSNRMDHMARVRDRLNKGYEIYHADRPAGGSQIVDRFEADTPALAQQYYEQFIRDYESDVDFDLRLRRATGILETLLALESGDWLLAESSQGVEIKKSSLFDQSLVTKAQSAPGISDKIKEFLNFKINNPGRVIGNDKPFASAGPIARALPKLRHYHLTRDLSLFYSMEGRAPAVIKLYGVFSHSDSGTGTPGNINKQKSFAQQLINQPVNELTLVPTVAKSKREHLDVMPNDGRPIPKGDETEYLGDLVAEMGDGFQLWSWTSHGTVTYYVFDTESRRCQLGTTGRPYKTNRDSFVIHGVYSGPKNRYRAADLYAFLILSRGLTLVSDYKQSAGGYRVWQELERRYGKEINIHGFDTRTNEPVNVTTQDEPDTHVDRATVKKAGPQMKKELGSISRDLRFVASAK